MKQINLTRSKESNKGFEDFLTAVSLEKGLFDEDSVDKLRPFVNVERGIDMQISYYMFKHPYPYIGVAKQYEFYMGKGDYSQFGQVVLLSDPKHPRYKTFLSTVKSGLAMVAGSYAARQGYSAYAVTTLYSGPVAEGEGPVVELLVFDKNDADQSDRTTHNN